MNERTIEFDFANPQTSSSRTYVHNLPSAGRAIYYVRNTGSINKEDNDGAFSVHDAVHDDGKPVKDGGKKIAVLEPGDEARHIAVQGYLLIRDYDDKDKKNVKGVLTLLETMCG